METAASDPERRFSPSELAGELGAKLGDVSYHVRELHKLGLLQRAGQRRKRGAVEHYYRAGAKLLS
jgi:DNA-binding MarR family transcriptional regulator